MSSCSTLEDSTYSSTSEGEEPDSDREEIEDSRRDQEDDPSKLLGTWLGQLQQMERGLEGLPAGHKLLSSNKLTIPTPRMDTYRFSMANMEDSQDVELDAILGELCALEDKLDREIMPKSQSANQALGNAWNGSSRPNYQNQNKNQQQPVVVETKFTSGHSRSNSGGGGTRPKFEIGGLQVDMDCEDFLRGQKMDLRTESPDNDSAFSDNVSMLSSESSASSGGVRGEGGHSSRSMSSQSSSMSLASSPTQVEQAARLKAEKIKIALEKMKEASIKKLFIKAFSADNSAKSLLIDERMTVGHVCKLLAEKNHVSMDPKWALVEQIPELYIERVYEDHEHVVENLLLWTRDSCNRLFFLEKSSKYDLFMNPQIYLLGGTSSEKHAEYDDDAKSVLLDEFFSTSNVGVPEVEGPLYLKSDGKKAWKKHFFVLRASGLYYCPKGKSKLSKDLLCLTTFDMNHVYVGLGWKKKYKAPTEFGFAIKHPQIQTKSSKYIKYLCAEDEVSLKQWVMGIRIAKYGMQLKENYDNLLRDIAEEDLENLANARSFSVSSVAKTSHSDDHTKAQENALKAFEKDMYLDQMDDEPPTTLEKLHKLRVISRQDSIKSSKSNASSSSGCPSERSSTGTPTTDHLVFETDFPMGTIKRKPSMTPKIPLTTTTRNLAKQSGEEGPHLDGTSIGSGSGGSCNGSLSGSLGRSTCGRFSLRRSYTDERILLGSLTRRRQNRQGTPTPPSTLLRDDFPLPPPPPDISNVSECMNFDTLPPPPPEAFRNATLNLDALPPPPVLPDDNNDVSWLNESNISALPPPPCLQNNTLERPSTLEKNCKKSNKTSPAVPPKPRKGVRRRQSESDARATPPRLSEHKNGLVIIKPKPSKQNLNLELSNCAEPSRNCNKNASPDRTSCVDNKKAANCRSRRTSAPCDASSQLQVHTVISPGTTTPVSPKPSACNRKSRSQHKPSPPKRSENTKLSSAFTAPQRRSASASAAPYDPDGYPPESFLRNLQKVMVRKWKVAQQLSTDNNITSHQIFGFRDPNCLPTAEETHTLQRSPSSPPPVPTHGEKYPVSRSISQSQTEHSNLESSKTYAVNPKKHPPPPPPKKSDNNKATLW